MLSGKTLRRPGLEPPSNRAPSRRATPTGSSRAPSSQASRISWSRSYPFFTGLSGFGRIARPRWSCGVAAALGAPVRTGAHIGAQNGAHVGARTCSRTGDGSQARQGRVRVAYRMRPSYFGSRRSAADEATQGHVWRRLGTRGARRRHLAHVRISMRCRSRVGAPSLPLFKHRGRSAIMRSCRGRFPQGP